jgi:hypothetical protein
MSTILEISTERKEEVFRYLDALRESGITNMSGAGKYITKTFAYNARDAKTLLMEWMETFGTRHPE